MVVIGRKGFNPTTTTKKKQLTTIVTEVDNRISGANHDCPPVVSGVADVATTAAVGGVVARRRADRVRPHLGRRLGALLESAGLAQLPVLREMTRWVAQK